MTLGGLISFGTEPNDICANGWYMAYGGGILITFHFFCFHRAIPVQSISREGQAERP